MAHLMDILGSLREATHEVSSPILGLKVAEGD